MNKKKAVSLECAGDFVWRNARLIERTLFAHLFVEPSARAVIAALMAFRNADGGFGNALEADVRAPSSMPVACEVAMIMLHQADIRDSSIASALCDYLA